MKSTVGIRLSKDAELKGTGITIEEEGGQAAAFGVPGAADVTAKLTIFAVNYNVLRIMSGMGGLAYSN